MLKNILIKDINALPSGCQLNGLKSAAINPPTARKNNGISIHTSTISITFVEVFILL